MKNSVSELLDKEKKNLLSAENNPYKNLLSLLISILGENDPNEVLSRLVLSSMVVTNADGGSIYVLKDNQLYFHTFFNKSLNLMGTVVDITKSTIRPIHLYDPNTKEKNDKFISTCTVLNKEIINITDVYKVKDYDITGVLSFDRKNKYKTQSLLSVPLISKDSVIGVGQLINAKNEKSKSIVSFTEKNVEIVEVLYKAAAPFIEMVSNMKDATNLIGTLSEVNAQGAWRNWLAKVRKEEAEG